MFIQNRGRSMIRIALCNSTLEEHTRIKDDLFRCKDMLKDFSTEEFYSGAELVASIKRNIKYDILLIDLSLQDMSGMDAAKEVRECDDEVLIILMSDKSQYVFESFVVRPLHYLLKPYDFSMFKEVIQRAVAQYHKQHFVYISKTSNKLISLGIDQIYYLESRDRTIRICTKDKEFTYYGRMYEAEAKLKSHRFVRTHQGYLVNLNHILSIGHDDIRLRNGERVLLSARRKKDVLKEISKLKI